MTDLLPPPRELLLDFGGRAPPPGKYRTLILSGRDGRPLKLSTFGNPNLPAPAPDHPDYARIRQEQQRVIDLLMGVHGDDLKVIAWTAMARRQNPCADPNIVAALGPLPPMTLETP